MDMGRGETAGAQCESQEKYRIVADYTYDWEYWISPQNQFLYVSPSCKRITGYSSREFIGNPDLLQRIIYPEDLEIFLSHQREKPAQRSDIEFRIITSSGELRWIHHLCQPVYDDSGRYAGIRGSNRDVTDRKQIEKELADAKARAELYLDLIAHDINNMNQVAQGYLELALQTLDVGGNIDQGGKALIEKPLQAVQDSSRLISNIRKLQRLAENDANARPVDLHDLFEKIKPRDFKTGDKVVTINMRDIPHCTVKGSDLLQDVFFNIISNAVKHSWPDRPVIVDVWVDHVDVDGRPYCRCTVEDNGPGISDELKPRLFDRSWRGKSRAQGKGLGLYLVKTLVDRYGGRVWAEDRVPGNHSMGAKFVVMLPVA